MRIALIAAVKRTTQGDLRAELMLGGRTVLQWQAELGFDLGCERVICLCDAATGAVLDLQREVEGAGKEFHAIRSNIQLASLVRADDELVMMLDGLVMDRSLAIDFALEGETLHKGIAVLPNTDALTQAYPDDFERIDRERHWAGLAIMRAGQVQHLAELPPDGDPMSLLLRLALQARTDCRDIGGHMDHGQNWLLAGDNNALTALEAHLIGAAVDVPPASGPARATAAFAARAMAPRGLESGAETGAGIAGVAMLAGLGLAAFGYGAGGIALAAVGAFAGNVSGAIASLRGALWLKTPGKVLEPGLMIGIEVASAVVLTLAYLQSSDAALESQIALPCLTVGLLYLAANGGRGRFSAFWRDRALHLVIFAIAAAMGHLGTALAVFGMAAMADLLLREALSSAKLES